MKVAAAVLGASLLFFLGVLTGAGRRETVPPPTAIPLGATNQPAGAGAARPSPAPDGGTKRGTTTTARTGATAPPAPTSPSGPSGSTDDTSAPTGATATTATTAPSGASGTSSTTGSGQVQQVDNQVDCTSARKQGKGRRVPCPSTTSSTGEGPGGGRNG